MSAKKFNMNGEEFPESILNAPKIKFLKPKKEINCPLILDEEDALFNKESIFKKNLQKNTKSGQENDLKFEKGKILKYMKNMSTKTLHDSTSNSNSNSDLEDICRSEQEEKIIFFPDLKI